MAMLRSEKAHQKTHMEARRSEVKSYSPLKKKRRDAQLSIPTWRDTSSLPPVDIAQASTVDVKEYSQVSRQTDVVERTKGPKWWVKIGDFGIRGEILWFIHADL
jgi:hypothetical protein